MPPGKRQQTNTALYTTITFVGLFILATVAAVIFYMKTEDYRTEAARLQAERDELASSAEIRKIGTLVGEKQPRKTRLGTMVDYLDEAVTLILGGLPEEEASAQVKVDTANRKVKDIIELVSQPKAPTKTAEGAPTNQFVELLTGGQFPAATETFDETMKNALPPEKLQELWESTVAQMGNFKSQLGTRTEKQDDFNIVLVTCEFENGALDVKVVYNAENQVAGLFFTPTPPQVLQSYQPGAEPSGQQTPFIEIADPNTTGVIRIAEKLKAKLDNVAGTANATAAQLEDLQNRFDDAMAVSFEKEQTLLAEKKKYQQQVNDIKQDYDQLQELMRQTTDQQVQTLMTQLDEERENRKQTYQGLLKTQAELKMAQDRMKRTQGMLQAIVPLPDAETPAYKPDGNIMLIDDPTKIVHLNIGSNERVYRGLTFSVYDRNMPIPKDGKGKAEVEVFGVGETFSAARIIRSEIKRPIIVGDIIANLIWDSQRTNVFVIAGDFDLDGDGNSDLNAVDSLKTLIQKWGGRVDDNVSVETDFVVLGTPPRVRRKPTFEQMEVDPIAMQRYEASLLRLDDYQQVQQKAETLLVPIFNLERFLYFIGYKEQSGRPGAF
ncbi:MAG: DUF3887 domain-containing protein [Planctomycetota bacterium]|nr:MAG: DUF3887 domain-containing protein [Planctomycetota bacterium]